MSLDVVGIRRPTEYESMFQSYANPQSSTKIESSPFSSMKDLCMIAGVLGYKHKLYEKDFKKDPNHIRIGIFKRRDIEVIKMIAVVHEKDIQVLEDGKRIAEIFEGYICGGMKIIAEELHDDSKISFNYLTMILNNR